MNFVLYVHDTGANPVWPGEPQAAAAKVQREINNLVLAYTMGRVTVDLIPENKALGDRVEEIERIVDGNVDDWFEAKEEVARLLDNWEQGDIAGPVNSLRVLFGLNEDGSEG